MDDALKEEVKEEGEAPVEEAGENTKADGVEETAEAPPAEETAADVNTDEAAEAEDADPNAGKGDETEEPAEEIAEETTKKE